MYNEFQAKETNFSSEQLTILEDFTSQALLDEITEIKSIKETKFRIPKHFTDAN